MLTNLVKDLRFSLRILLRHPGFTFVAVVILAFGIAANATVFSFVDSILLEPLDYPSSSRLVQIWEWNRHTQERSWVYYGNYRDWKERGRTFDELALYNVWEANVWGDPEPERVKTNWVSGNYFDLLGAQAMLGRTFSMDDEEVGQHRVAVISYSLWQRRFGGDPGVLGEKLRMAENLFEVVGVLPAAFYHPGAPQLEQPELFLPSADDPDYRHHRSGYTWERAIGRMKTGVSLAEAQDDLNRIARELEAEYPETNAERGVVLEPLQQFVVGDLRSELRLLLLAVGLVLLVVCANLGSLVSIRSAGRRREMALRMALGAPRARLVRQLTIESLVLAMASAMLGTLLGLAAVAVLRSSPWLDFPRSGEVAFDTTAALFTFAVTLVGVMFFGLLPAWSSLSGNMQGDLKDGARGAGGRRGGWQRVLVVAEVALALVLVAGAGLLIRSYQRILDSHPGFRPQGVLVMDMTLDGERYEDKAQVLKTWDEVTSLLLAQPGIQAVGGIIMPPLLTHDDTPTPYLLENREPPPKGQEPIAQMQVITPGYLDAMGLDLLEGRNFEDHDRRNTIPVALVNKTLAERTWPGESPLGKRLRLPTINDSRWLAERSPWLTVVGVVADVRLYELDVDPVPEVYRPHAQAPWEAMNLVVESTMDPAELLPIIRREVRSVDPNAPLRRITTMTAAYDNSLTRRRLVLGVLGAFAVAALVLAAVGIYGAVAWSVAQRTQEIGLRMAVGARGRDILRMVLVQSGRLFAFGFVLGLPLAWMLTRAMSGMLFGIGGFDPLTFVVAGGVLLTAALIASFGPSWRASRVDPLVALRYE